MNDRELYDRAHRTLVACWEAHARGATSAAVHRRPGVSLAVFPTGPERAVYNNAVLDRELAPAERDGVLDVVASAYAAAGIGRFAVWVHETEEAVRIELERRGYALDAATRAMGIVLGDARLPRMRLDVGPPSWREHLRTLGLPPDFLAGADRAAYRVVVARLDGEPVATGLTFDHGGDCGIFNVFTAARARRRGLGLALTTVQVHDARARGCATASLQATPMAERIYASVGFRDLGRILEYVPPDPAPD